MVQKLIAITPPLFINRTKVAGNVIFFVFKHFNYLVCFCLSDIFFGLHLSPFLQNAGSTSITSAGAVCVIAAGYDVIPSDNQFLLPKGDNASVAAESQKDEDPLQRIDDGEGVPELRDVLAHESQDPGEPQDTRQLLRKNRRVLRDKLDTERGWS